MSKTILMFIGYLILSLIGWSFVLFLIPYWTGATVQEANEFRDLLRLPAAVVTAFVLTRRWHKAQANAPLKPPNLT